jgi:glycosyltransferase involved in cell wall biosynthesis
VKILYHHRTRSKDGQTVHIDELTAALRRLGHEIVMVAPAAMEHEAFGADAGLVAWLKRHLPLAVYEILEFIYSFGAYARLRRAYLRHRPDVLYERYNLFLPAGAWLKRRYGLPMLSEVNAPIAQERAKFDGLFFRCFAGWSERVVWRAADYVLPVTAVLADYVRMHGVPDSRIQVIPNGIDPTRFATAPDRPTAKARLGLDGKLVLGFTGFVRSWHGLERVVDFLADTADKGGAPLHFIVVGEGPARADIECRAAERRVADRVTFTGVVERDAIADVVAAFDIALQPDVVAYASPLKLFEYMALGCAIVAPDTPNIREVLIDGDSAALFDPADKLAFRKALERLCDNAPLRCRMGEAAKRLIAERDYTWDANARRIEALFRNLLADSTRR